METERIALSQRERDRLRVLHEIQQKHLTQVAAATRLKISDRQVRRMLLRLREARRSLAGSRTTRTAIEPQVGSPLGAEDFGAGAATLCGLRTHAGRRTLGPGGFLR